MSPTPPATLSDWLPTPQAAQLLGISHSTLKRYASRDRLLEEGTHFRRGPHANTPLLWHVPRCFQAIRGGTP
ncbi:helix-turn-helix domain-containing protein [Synechococcus sp. CBW1004]|uniref:helix-turn-helix domain-containing protein n=1 Tax=Synechococcus sp. CBW1004 TaxID=1353136 RepID=UPI0018CEDF73|nr:helix-turn-helix domain-containing protein [Synechococcus sp. CBW1004]QPN61965.1 helix-turn-helix domain-containing protein [Synechococcus sp. CBW1004]